MHKILVSKSLIVIACLAFGGLVNCSHGQVIGGGGGGDEPDPILFYGTNNSGFVQNGPGGADNLVLFEVIPIDDPKMIPEIDMLPSVQFSIVGNLDGNSGQSLGTFSGLEWSTGAPGVGTLVGCVLDEGNGNGEFYQIDPNTASTSLIGNSPSGFVTTLIPHPTGSDYFTTPEIGFPVVGGSGSGLVIAVVFNEVDGIVEEINVVNPGQGYQFGDIVSFSFAPNARFTVTGVVGSDFSDLAFNPINGLMYGLMNDITDNGGNLEFGNNTIWVDNDGDLVPETRVSSAIFVPPGVPMATLASGMAFDAAGSVFIYDNMAEVLMSGGLGFVEPVLGGGDTGLDSTELLHGNGLTVTDQTVFISSDATINNLRNTAVSFYQIPPPPPAMVDPPPEVIPASAFPLTFHQGGFQAAVAIGDLVPAIADLSDLPPTFPDNVIVNRGIPGKNAILEAVVVSDDFRYCIWPELSPPKVAPIDLTFVYTVPNAANLTLLGIEIESHASTANLEHFISVFNVNTSEFDLLGSESVNFQTDGLITVDLSTSIADYVDNSSGTLTCRIETRPVGPVLVFPWQLKYDSVLVVSE